MGTINEKLFKENHETKAIEQKNICEESEKNSLQGKNVTNESSISRNSKKKFYKKDEMELWVNPICGNSLKDRELVHSSSGNNIINSPLSSVKDCKSNTIFRNFDKKIDEIIKSSKKDTKSLKQSQTLQRKKSNTSETFSEKIEAKKSINNKNDAQKPDKSLFTSKDDKSLFNFADKVEDLEN